MYSLSFAVKSNTAKGVFGVSAEKRDLFWERALLKKHPCLIPLNLFQLKWAHKKTSLSLYMCALRISEFRRPVPAFSRVRREAWTHWLGQCYQNPTWGQNQFWLSIQRQTTPKKKELIYVHVASALNTRSHFCRTLLHGGEFILCFVWVKTRDSLIFASANCLWSVFFHLSCRKKLEVGMKKSCLSHLRETHPCTLPQPCSCKYLCRKSPSLAHPV